MVVCAAWGLTQTGHSIQPLVEYFPFLEDLGLPLVLRQVGEQLLVAPGGGGVLLRHRVVEELPGGDGLQTQTGHSIQPLVEYFPFLEEFFPQQPESRPAAAPVTRSRVSPGSRAVVLVSPLCSAR